jgi:hypothetical protein
MIKISLLCVRVNAAIQDHVIDYCRGNHSKLFHIYLKLMGPTLKVLATFRSTRMICNADKRDGFRESLIMVLRCPE